VHNWKNVVERLDDTPERYAHYFHGFSRYVACITDSEIEHLGYTMGRIFVEFQKEVYDKDENLLVNEFHERISELKEVHPELSKNRYWHTFEDNAFSKNPDVWDKIDLESVERADVRVHQRHHEAQTHIKQDPMNPDSSA
jgi:hypothetical protein